MSQVDDQILELECGRKRVRSKRDQTTKRRIIVSDEQESQLAHSSELSSPVLIMTQAVYRRILTELHWPPERGGLLLGPKDHEVVTHFHLDDNSDATSVSLTFDHASLNDALKRYVAAGLDCKGYVHEHPPGCDRPSYGDLAVVQALFAKEKNRGLQRFLLPIVASGVLHPFIIERNDLDKGAACAAYATLVLV